MISGILIKMSSTCGCSVSPLTSNLAVNHAALVWKSTHAVAVRFSCADMAQTTGQLRIQYIFPAWRQKRIRSTQAHVCFSFAHGRILVHFAVNMVVVNFAQCCKRAVTGLGIYFPTRWVNCWIISKSPAILIHQIYIFGGPDRTSWSPRSGKLTSLWKLCHL